MNHWFECNYTVIVIHSTFYTHHMVSIPFVQTLKILRKWVLSTTTTTISNNKFSKSVAVFNMVTIDTINISIKWVYLFECVYILIEIWAKNNDAQIKSMELNLMGFNLLECLSGSDVSQISSCYFSIQSNWIWSIWMEYMDRINPCKHSHVHAHAHICHLTVTNCLPPVYWLWMDRHIWLLFYFCVYD